MQRASRELEITLESRDHFLSELDALKYERGQLKPEDELTVSELEKKIKNARSEKRAKEWGVKLVELLRTKENYSSLSKQIAEKEQELNQANAYVDRLKSVLTYVKDPNDPTRGNYKVIGFRHFGPDSEITQITLAERDIAKIDRGFYRKRHQNLSEEQLTARIKRDILGKNWETRDAYLDDLQRTRNQELKDLYTAHSPLLRAASRKVADSKTELTEAYNGDDKALEERLTGLVGQTAQAQTNYTDKQVQALEERQEKYAGELLKTYDKSIALPRYNRLKYGILAVGAAVVLTAGALAYHWTRPHDTSNLENKVNKTEQTAPTPGGIDALNNARVYGFSKGLLQDMYNYNPQGFIAAFGITPSAQNQLPKWFNGSNSDGEINPTKDGIALRVDDGKSTFYLFKANASSPDDRAYATFNATAQGAKQFTSGYLAQNPGRVSEMKIISLGPN